MVNDAAVFVHSYDPYGTETVSYGGGDGLPSNPFTFKAGIDDIATGLVKFGQRCYNPYIGAWTQQDTLDSPLDPANGNRYAYAASDPINGSDASGTITVKQACTALSGEEAFFAVVGGVGAILALIPPHRPRGRWARSWLRCLHWGRCRCQTTDWL